MDLQNLKEEATTEEVLEGETDEVKREEFLRTILHMKTREIASLKAAHQSSDSNLKNHIRSMENTIQTLQNTIQTLQNTIQTLQNTIQTPQNTIQTLQNAISTYQYTIRQQQQTISQLQGQPGGMNLGQQHSQNE